MLEVSWDITDGWGAPSIVPVHELSLKPFNMTLQHGLEGFEGMKAYKDPAGCIRTLRPLTYAQRFAKTCSELCLPAFDPIELVRCIEKLIRLDWRWVPAYPSSLYIRSVVMTMESGLSLTPPKEALLYVVTSPVAPPAEVPVRLLVDQNGVRVPQGGPGLVRLGGSYAHSASRKLDIKSKGFDGLLWLRGDAITEADQSNIFFHWTNTKNVTELVTPSLNDTVLPGVYRDTVCRLASGNKKVPLHSTQVLLKDLVAAAREKRVVLLVSSEDRYMRSSPAARRRAWSRSVLSSTGLTSWCPASRRAKCVTNSGRCSTTFWYPL